MEVVVEEPEVEELREEEELEFWAGEKAKGV